MMFSNEQKMYIVLNMISDIKDSVSGKEDAKIDYQIASRIYNNAFSSMVLHGYEPVMTMKDEIAILSMEFEGKTYECPARTVKNNLKSEFYKLEEKIEGLKEAIQEEDKKIAEQDREYKKKKNSKQEPANNETKVAETVKTEPEAKAEPGSSEEPQFVSLFDKAPVTPVMATEEPKEETAEIIGTETEATETHETETVKETIQIAETDLMEDTLDAAENETGAALAEKEEDEARDEKPLDEAVIEIDLPVSDESEESSIPEPEAASEECSIPVIEEPINERNSQESFSMEVSPTEEESQEVIPVEHQNDPEDIPEVLEETSEAFKQDTDAMMMDSENTNAEVLVTEADEIAETVTLTDETTSETDVVQEHKFQKKEPQPVSEIEPEIVTEPEPEQPSRQTKQEKGGFFSRFLPKSKSAEQKRVEEKIEAVAETMVEDPVEIPEKEDEIPADMICHTHYVTLKKTYGTQALGPYIIQIWPTEVVELNENKVQSNIFVRAQSPNGTVIYKTNEGKAKYIILTIDDKQFNVFGYWQNGEFLSDVATINKTASIYTKMEQVDKKSPVEPTDEFLDQFRLREPRRPEFFVVPLDNVNHGEENIPIAAYARSNDKNYVINKKGKGNSLRFSYAGETSEISGRWENGKFVFTMKPVSESN